MKTFFTRTFRVYLFQIAILVLSLLSLATGWLMWKSQDPRFASIFSGLCTGLIVAVVQYILQWNEHSDTQRIRKLGVVRIMSHRDDRVYYDSLISKSRAQIQLIGNTASRFLEDFASKTRADKTCLLQALGRNVKVQILVPTDQSLSPSERTRLHDALDRMRELEAQYSGYFECRRYDHPPCHSLVRVDDQCLVGPIFRGVPSKDSPTTHVFTSSPLAAEYLKYFDSEWAAGTPL